MDLKQVQYFVTVVEQGSINAAAQKLQMTQPPVSKQIQLLEQELGCSLFLRGSRPLELTQEGRLFYSRSLHLLAMASGMIQAVADCRNAQGGTLRLGVVSSVSEWAAQTCLSDFHRSHPGLDFAIYEGHTYQILEQLKSRQLDLGLVRTPFAERGFSCVFLPQRPMLAVWNPRFFSLPGKVPLSMEELARLPLILYRRWEQIIDEAFASRGLIPRYLVVGDNARTTLAFAETGLGVSLQPASMADAARAAGLTARPIGAPSLSSQVALVQNEDGCDTAAGRAFWDFFCRNYRPDVKPAPAT